MSITGPKSTFTVVVGEADAGSCDRDARRLRRPFLGVFFECCNVYARIYKNPAGTAYEGRCPHCCGKLRVAIGDGGTNRRFFKAR